MTELDRDLSESGRSANSSDGRLLEIAPLALRAKDAARALGISERQLWTLTNAGEIPHVRIGRSIVYHVASLDAWLKKRAKGGK